MADLKGDVLERNPVTEALAQTKRPDSAGAPPVRVGCRHLPRSHETLASRVDPQASSRPDTAAGDVVRRRSFPMSHLIR